MSQPVNVLLAVAVVALLLVRQFRARRLGTDRRWWLLPAVLGGAALTGSGLLDGRHRATSAVLLGAELLVAVALGLGWAATTRVWAEADGSVWSRGTGASAAVWGVGIALRVGLYALGSALGVRQDSSAVLLALAVTLLVRAGVLTWRSSTLAPARGAARTYGGPVVPPRWKERV
ncbi:DUF1453 domain-containing protein [Streptomyces sp. NPDC008150]|uniref:DUF1453 domain-containing protein n=1 Tax=Streptomyces sp. NPDC008150 TaxID=3364816 RepID=UPI0036E1E48A